MKAVWKGAVIAESSDCIEVEGNQYFPQSSVQTDYLQNSPLTTVCPWKGTAHYYNIQVGDAVNENAAWYYPSPKQAAKNITGYVAFWKGVEVR